MAAPFLARHASTILRQLNERAGPLLKQFEAIDALNYRPAFENACALLGAHLAK
jgi:hypothetical protein